MTKENYKAWEIKVNAFDPSQPIEEQLKFLLNFAILAPSGHNSQPWKCKISSNIIYIYINHERSLFQSDPRQRQLYISFGCFLENLMIAAEYYGLAGLFENEFSELKKQDQTFKITFNKIGNIKNELSNLIFQIPLRHSNRYKYKMKLPAASFTTQAEGFNTTDTKIIFVSDIYQKEKIAQIIQQAQVDAMEDANFRDELSHYIKSNFTNNKFGMPGFTLGIPASVSIIAGSLIKKINLSKLSAKQDLQLLEKFTPAIGFICASEDNKTAWLKAGRIFQRLWLLATLNNLVFSVWAAAVQIESKSKELGQILKTDFKPMVIFRVGYPTIKPKPSPRFFAEDILQN